MSWEHLLSTPKPTIFTTTDATQPPGKSSLPAILTLTRRHGNGLAENVICSKAINGSPQPKGNVRQMAGSFPSLEQGTLALHVLGISQSPHGLHFLPAPVFGIIHLFP